MLGRAVILAATLALVGAAPASAARVVLAAYGTGETHCTITVTKTDYAFSTHYNFGGHTSCSRAIEQTGQARMGDAYASLCSAFATTCESSGGWEGEPNPGSAYYNVTLVAPFGQGWAASSVYPQGSCSGGGSDRLTCTFSAGNFLTVSI